MKRRVKIDNYNAVAEQVNSDLQTLDHYVAKHFYAGKKNNHFRGEGYHDRADQVDDGGIHILCQ